MVFPTYRVNCEGFDFTSHHICIMHNEMYDFMNDHVIQDMLELTNFIITNITAGRKNRWFANIAPRNVYPLYGI